MTKKKRQDGDLQEGGASKRAIGQREAQGKVANSRILTIGAATLIGVLVIVGMVGVLSDNSIADALQLGAADADMVNIESGQAHAATAPQATDRETRYLGPESNLAGLMLAENGDAPLEGPTLVWFHADW